METIEAGVISNILKKLKGILSDIFEYALNNYSENIQGIEVDDNGIVYIKRVTFGDGTVARVKLVPKDESKNLYHATIECIGGPGKQNGVKKYDRDVTFSSDDDRGLIKMLTKYADDYLDATFESMRTDYTDSSTIIKLNKITSSTDISIGINKIIVGSSLLPVPTMNNINAILDQEDFLAELPDGESFVAISDEGDNLEAQILNDYTCGDDNNITANSILYAISKCYATQLYLYAIQCNVVGDGIADVYKLLDGSSYTINDTIRILFDIYRSLTPVQFINMQQVTGDVCECMQFDVGCSISAQEAREFIYTVYDDYRACLQILQYNLSDTDFDKLTYAIQNATDFLGCLQRELYA